MLSITLRYILIFLKTFGFNPYDVKVIEQLSNIC